MRLLLLVLFAWVQWSHGLHARMPRLDYPHHRGLHHSHHRLANKSAVVHGPEPHTLHMRHVGHHIEYNHNGGAARITAKANIYLTDHPIVYLETPFYAAVEYNMVACNWTTLTIATGPGPIDEQPFQGEPFLVATSRWRCRLHKRQGLKGHPLYRKVFAPPPASRTS